MTPDAPLSDEELIRAVWACAGDLYIYDYPHVADARMKVVDSYRALSSRVKQLEQSTDDCHVKCVLALDGTPDRDGDILLPSWERIERLKAELADAQALLSEEPRSKTSLPPEFQKLWESCIDLSDKAAFKPVFKHLERLEEKLAEERQQHAALAARCQALEESVTVYREEVKYVLTHLNLCSESRTIDGDGPIGELYGRMHEWEYLVEHDHLIDSKQTPATGGETGGEP